MRVILSTLLLAIVSTQSVANPQATTTINRLRQQEGIGPLVYSTKLEAAAANHAADMVAAEFFSHVGSDGSDVADRVARTGYRWCIVAENIAKGQRDLTAVMQAWDASPGHRANMLSLEVTEFALTQSEDFTWVMVLAAPGC